MNEINYILMSIRPKYSNLIFSGQKKYELRRKIPKAQSGDVIVIYSSSPEKRMKGTARVKRVLSKPANQLWEIVVNSSGVTRSEFDKYFEGLDCVHAIELEEITLFNDGTALEEMRNRVKGFRPPQNYSYIRNQEFLTACTV